MNEFLTHVFNPLILVYLISTMLALGSSLKISQIVGPLSNLRVTISVMAASYIILPLIAIAVSQLFGIEPSLRNGLVLLAMSAGSEAGPKFTTNSNGNAGLSVGIVILSIGITIFYIPFMLGVFLPEVHYSMGHLLLKLLLTVVAPLLLGLFIKTRFNKIAENLAKYLHKVSSVSLLLTALVMVMLYYEQIINLFGTGALVAGFIFVVAGFITGYLLGCPDSGSRLAMGYMHGTRNASVAIMIASQVFSDQPNVISMIATVAVIMLLLLLPLSYLYKIKPVLVVISN